MACLLCSATAAAMLGIGVRQLHREAERYGIQPTPVQLTPRRGGAQTKQFYKPEQVEQLRVKREADARRVPVSSPRLPQH